VLHFETSIEDAVEQFAAALPDGARVLDAGSGEGMYRHYFKRHRYVGVDLGVGDGAWIIPTSMRWLTWRRCLLTMHRSMPR